MAPTSRPEGERLDFSPGLKRVLAAGSLWVEPGVRHEPGWLVEADGLVLETGSGPPPAPQGAILYDLGDLLLAPAPSDAHVHLALDPFPEGRFSDRIQEAADWGLAGVRDGGDKTCLVLSRRGEVETRLALASPGTALHAPGRYGSFIGRAVSGRDQAEQAVTDLARAGADLIKVLASGPVSLTEYGRVGPPQFSADDLADLVRAARAQGLGVMAHANGAEAVRDCLSAGAASIEHGYFMGQEALRLMADAQAVWVPTIIPLAALAAKETDPARLDRLRRTISDQREQLLKAFDLGVKTALGSDAGSPGVAVGPGLFEEMKLWLETGLSVDQVLTGAKASAELIEPDPDAGTLRPGRPAQLVGLARPFFSERPLFTAGPAPFQASQEVSPPCRTSSL